MARRKHYTIRATIKKRPPTKEDQMVYDKIMDMYLVRLIEIAAKENSK
ncbi:hypothetical protein [Ornithinibacillus sp. 179-J 7C1 HS]